MRNRRFALPRARAAAACRQQQAVSRRGLDRTHCAHLIESITLPFVSQQPRFQEMGLLSYSVLMRNVRAGNRQQAIKTPYRPRLCCSGKNFHVRYSTSTPGWKLHRVAPAGGGHGGYTTHDGREQALRSAGDGYPPYRYNGAPLRIEGPNG